MELQSTYSTILVSFSQHNKQNSTIWVLEIDEFGSDWCFSQSMSRILLFFFQEKTFSYVFFLFCFEFFFFHLKLLKPFHNFESRWITILKSLAFYCKPRSSHSAFESWKLGQSCQRLWQLLLSSRSCRMKWAWIIFVPLLRDFMQLVQCWILWLICWFNNHLPDCLSILFVVIFACQKIKGFHWIPPFILL